MNQQITINGQTITLTEDDIKMLAEKHGVRAGNDYWWVPAEGENIFILFSHGEVAQSNQGYFADRNDPKAFTQGNIFLDRESAELTRDWQRRNPYFPRAMARLEAAVKEANGGWVADWDDDSQEKWSHYLGNGEIKVTDWYCDRFSTLPHCPTREIAESIAKSHEAELRILLGR